MMRFQDRTLSRPILAAQALALVAALSTACARPTPRASSRNPAEIDVAQLWVEPADFDSRDLFTGPGGAELAPEPTEQFTLVKIDRKGYSPGYQVKDAKGTTWDVKLGPEAQTEIVTSRALWAMGYHQPTIYYLPNWVLVDKQPTSQEGGRFRPDLPDRKVVGGWSWYENDFVDTMPFKGLLVANLILNNWDWKTSNNKIYDVVRPDGFGTRQYVVRDLGASLGKTSFPKYLKFFPARGFGQGSRNDLEDFEAQGFIKRVEGSDVAFDYRGIHQPLVDTVTAENVIWTCRLMTRVSDKQWDDAFRAAGYPDQTRQRYIAKLKSKIAEGLALERS